MTDRTREHKRVAIDEVRKVPGARITFDEGRRHIKGSITMLGKRATVIVQISRSSNHSREHAIRKDVCRAISMLSGMANPPLPFNQHTSQDTPGFVETFRRVP